MDHWGRPITGRAAKSTATDEVSDADRAAEAAILDAIRSAHPDDAIVSEEGGAASGGSGRRWLVDPLDGTINFLYRIPHWCVSVACLDEEGALIAAVHDPVKQELFIAERGIGALLKRTSQDPAAEGVPLAASTLSDPALALLVTGYAYDADERRRQQRQEGEIVGSIRDLRRTGSAALDLAYVASGRVDAYWETFANPWDWAAGRLLVQEAGGRVTDVPGVRAGVPGILASGPNVHDQLLAMIRAIAPA